MKNAFSLIELIVWITISMLLMVSVGIFITNWMNNIFIWQKTLENTDEIINFTNILNKSIGLIQTWSFAPINTSSGIIFKRWQNFWDGWFSYIWTEILDQVYCNSDSENSETNNLFIKNFIPFEEQWEDIFIDYDSILISTGIMIWEEMYRSYQKENVIKDSNWNIIVWKGIFGDKFLEWTNATDIYLNSPTWLATDWTNLYISDTLNNRILYLDSNSKIHLLLDENDWLNEPTWLYYDEHSLYISNSWNWEILKYSSKNINNPSSLTLTWFTISNVSKVEISFLWASNIWLSDYNTWSINFVDITTSTDYLTWSTNKLKYYFVNYNSESNQWTCSWNEIDLILDNPIQCVSSWTWKTSIYQNMTISNIIVNNIINTTNTWSYFIDLKLLNSSNNILYQNYFPYFTKSDNDLTTKWDNTLSVLYSWLNYPTWIWWVWNNDFNEFWDRSFDDDLRYHSSDYLLNIPVKSLNITNIANDLLTIIFKYYKSYNCYNLDQKIEKTFILKKNLK